MSEKTSDNKSVDLYELYSRVKQIAEAMGGCASAIAVGRSLPSAMFGSPRGEIVSPLRVMMPDGFRVDFAAYYPSSIGETLTVRAVRTHGGSRKTDWLLRLAPDGWRRGQVPLSDDEIRGCLTPEGPRATES